jgi:hypothetical protein
MASKNNPIEGNASIVVSRGMCSSVTSYPASRNTSETPVEAASAFPTVAES